jgi:hypothetical protein
MRSNRPHALDAGLRCCFRGRGIPPLLQTERTRLTRAQPGRYFSRAWYLGISLVALLSAKLCSVPCYAESPSAAERSRTNAPLGTYATASPVSISVHLNTNGTYEVKSGSQAEQGRWTWDAKQQEFNLMPRSGKVRFDIRRLRLDRADPAALQWIPTASFTHGAGAMDYLRLIKCQ